MSSAIDQTPPSGHPALANPITTAPGQTTNTMRGTALLVSALLLAFGSHASSAGKPRSFEVDFNKCFAHEGPDPYLFTFSGLASGDVKGTVEARVLTFTPGIEPHENYIEADYVLTGTVPFTARVGGRENDQTSLAVLRGYVSQGPAWLLGAGVHNEFRNYRKPDGTPCSRGTLFITPRWRQSLTDD